jgi:hypothetical protein
MPKQNKPTLRIAKLPNLTPVKLTVSLEPEVYNMLEDYTKIYNDSYQDAAKPTELVPSMIAKFMAMDSGFKRARTSLHK